MIYRKPKDLIIQVEDRLLGQIIVYWTYYNKPCPLNILGAKTEGLSAITTRMDNADAGSFVFVLCERLRVKLYDRETKKPLTVEDVFM